MAEYNFEIWSIWKAFWTTVSFFFFPIPQSQKSHGRTLFFQGPKAAPKPQKKIIASITANSHFHWIRNWVPTEKMNEDDPKTPAFPRLLD